MNEFGLGFLQSVLAGVTVAAIGAAAIVLFWGRVTQRFLVDQNRVPLVELDFDRGLARNIGSESAVNIAVYHVTVDPGKNRMSIEYRAGLPNLVAGDRSCVDIMTICCVAQQEVFLLQYENATGVLFHALIEPEAPRGDAPIYHSPHRIGRCDCWHRLDTAPDLHVTRRVPRWVRRDLRLMSWLRCRLTHRSIFK